MRPPEKLQAPCSLSAFRVRVGFSLVELLVVIAIIGLVTVLAVPGVESHLGAIYLGGAAQRLADEFAQARQLAIVRNRVVELRFYQEGSGQLAGEFRRTAIVLPGDKPVWMSSGQELPQGILLDRDASFSTVLSGAASTEGNEAPGKLRGLEYRSVRFLPAGRVEIPGGADPPLLLTLRGANSQQDSEDLPAVNFVTFALDSITGRATVYQP